VSRRTEKQSLALHNYNNLRQTGQGSNLTRLGLQAKTIFNTMFDIPHFLRLKKRNAKKELEISWPTDVRHNAGLMPPQYYPNSCDSLSSRSESPSPRPVKRPYPSVEESLREEKERMLRERGEPVMNRRRRVRGGSVSTLSISSRQCVCGHC